MKYKVQIVVSKGENEKNRTVMNNSSTTINSDKDLTIAEIKQKCKEWYDLLPPSSVILEEKLYIGNKEKTDNNEVLGYTHAMEYNLLVK